MDTKRVRLRWLFWVPYGVVWTVHVVLCLAAFVLIFGGSMLQGLRDRLRERLLPVGKGTEEKVA